MRVRRICAAAVVWVWLAPGCADEPAECTGHATSCGSFETAEACRVE